MKKPKTEKRDICVFPYKNKNNCNCQIDNKIRYLIKYFIKKMAIIQLKHFAI